MVRSIGFGSALHFEVLGEQILKGYKADKDDSYYMANFGVSPRVTSLIFKKIDAKGRKVSPKYLLITLFFMKVYPSERTLQSISGVSRETTRSWVWFIISMIARLKKDVVSLCNLKQICIN